MTQMKVITWTNAASAVALNKDFGFTVASITTTDQTNGGQWTWNSSMGSGYYVRVDTGAVTSTNGFTPLAQSYRIGATITGFSNAADGVITATNVADFGFAIGDTIVVVDLVDDVSQTTSLNGTFTVKSVTGTTITVEDSTSSSSVYVSGGIAIRVSDINGDPVRQENKAIRGVTIGTGVVGANNAVMMAVAYSADPAC